MSRPEDVASIERDTREKYSGASYSPDSICRIVPQNPADFFDILLNYRLALVRECGRDAVVLDLCCATGEHLMDVVSAMKRGVGLDFSAPFVERARETKEARGIANVEFVEGNARQLPFEDGSFDLVYCFSSLYHIPRVDEVIAEIARVLRPSGVCILEMGNRWSLNTLVCNASPELATPCHHSVPEMRRMIRSAGLVVRRHRAFQILPYWGTRPRWLGLFLRGFWKRMLQRRVCGRMLDEWISNLPGLRSLAFRQFFVCGKAQEPTG